MEELEAVDWYHQRADATDDPDAGGGARHNRDEEKEHAAMTLEWLRRHDPVLDQHLRTYLFTEGSIVEIEHEAEHEDGECIGEPVARDRKPAKGRVSCEPPVPRARTDHRGRLGRDRGRVEPDAAHLPRRPQAGRLLRAARLGGVRGRSRPGRSDQVAARPTSVPRCARCSRSSSCAPTSPSHAPSSTRSSAAASHPISIRCATRRCAWPRPRTRRSSTASARPGSRV